MKRWGCLVIGLTACTPKAPAALPEGPAAPEVAAMQDAGAVLPAGAPAPPLEAPWPPPATTHGWPSASGLAPGVVLDDSPHLWCGPLVFDDLVVVGDEHGLRSYVLGKPAPIARVASNLPAVAPRLFAGIVLGMLDGELVALDARTLATRWKTRLVDEPEAKRWDGTHLRELLSDGSRLVAALWTQASDAAEMVALDLATGRVAWRTPTKTHGDSRRMAIAGDRLLLWEPDVLAALSLATSERLWAAELPAPEKSGYGSVVAVPDRIVAEGSDGAHRASSVAVLDAASGRILRRENLSDWDFHANALEGRTLYRARVEADRASGIRYEALDVDSGKVLWVAGPVPGAILSFDLLLLDADVVYAENSQGSLHAYDRATGALRWWWGFHMFGHNHAVARPAPGAPGVLVVGATVFERRPTPAPAPVVTFSGHMLDEGKPVAHAVVEVDDYQTRTSASGEYRVSVPMRGLARVTGRGPRGIALEYVTPPEDGQVTLDLNVTKRRRHQEDSQ